ncbi:MULTISPECIES: hypothetical protein [unclassified Bradyrhizobium]|uniref:hypothetical protein n=1 Tax=unclassified Bradyrhizobium TaxID=2631580 RepID=UPI003396C9A3
MKHDAYRMQVTRENQRVWLLSRNGASANRQCRSDDLKETGSASSGCFDLQILRATPSPLCAPWSLYIWPLRLHQRENALSVLLAKSLAFAHAVQLSFLIFGVQSLASLFSDQRFQFGRSPFTCNHLVLNLP